MTTSIDENPKTRVTYRADNLWASGLQLCPVVLMHGNVAVFIQLRRINLATLHAVLLTSTHTGVGGDDKSKTLTYSCTDYVLLFLTRQSPFRLR